MTSQTPAPPGEATGQRHVTRVRDGAAAETDDCLVVEEPLEIRVNDERFTVTMRTPGHDFELARGLLLTEGVIRSADDIGQIRYCDAGDPGDADASNLVTVRLKQEPSAARLWQRTLMAGTSCGLCGKAALEAVRLQANPVPDGGLFSRETLLSFPQTMRRRQAVFQRTGGLHAVALFDQNGGCRALFEDIGRHNATDKAIGYGLAQGWLPCRPGDEPLALLVSGRASFEITQKALMARIAVVCSVSAASTLAVDLAAACNQTLIGFLREAGMTIYTGEQRVLGRTE